MDYLGVIRQPNFAKLWASQILSQVAFNLLNFALIIRVFDLARHTNFANISVGLLVLSFGLPSLFLAAVAGVYADYWDRRHIMIICNCLRALLVPLYIMFQGNLILILILSFVISSITQFFTPAEAATIPKVVKTSLSAANALFVFSLYGSFIVGYSVSASVIAWLGATGPYFLTALMFTLATACSLWLPSQRAETKPGHLVRRLNVWNDLKSNYNFIRHHRRIRFSIFQLTITQAVLGVVLTLAPALSLSVLHVPLQRASTILIVPAGIGMVLGVLMITHLHSRWEKMSVLMYSLIAGSAVLMLLGLTGQLYRTHEGHSVVPAYWVPYTVASITFLLGLLNAIISASAQTVLQEGTSDETRGQVFGALNMMINIAATLPIMLSGILADLFSVTKVITALGAVVLIYTLVQRQRMSIRQL